MLLGDSGCTLLFTGFNGLVITCESERFDGGNSNAISRVQERWIVQCLGPADQSATGDVRVGSIRVQDCYETCCSVHVVIVQADQGSEVQCLGIKEIHVKFR